MCTENLHIHLDCPSCKMALSIEQEMRSDAQYFTRWKIANIAQRIIFLLIYAHMHLSAFFVQFRAQYFSCTI
jgi:hypothetical protein